MSYFGIELKDGQCWTSPSLTAGVVIKHIIEPDVVCWYWADEPSDLRLGLKSAIESMLVNANARVTVSEDLLWD